MALESKAILGHQGNRMARLRLVKPAPEPIVFTHENRMGVTFYLHEGKTKTGKPRYFFTRDIRDGSLVELPEGYEVSESINGVVSVRKKKPGEVSVPAEDVTLVEAALGRHPHLRWYKAQAVGSAILIFEPDPRPGDLRSLGDLVGFSGRLGPGEQYMEERMKKARYAPVMKFEREGDRYAVFRMTYRGHGGWSYPLDSGTLAELIKKFVPKVGTEKFFDLM
jgi:hypothetical protein